jgi:anti-sigma regulatory factor (Ser/Thr protein kinase)
MGQLRTGLRAYALEGHGPAATLRLVDGLLQTIRDRGMATVAYAVVEPDSGAMTIASAGHPPPLVLAPDGSARFVEVKPSPPLGTVPFGGYAETHATLEAGETVVLYTDGLVETRGAPLDETLEALRQAAEEAADAESADRMCERLLRARLPSRTAEDDVAVVALRRCVVADALRLRLPAEPAVLRSVRRSLGRWLREHDAGEDDVRAVTLACGEACANAIEHAYPPGPATFELEAGVEDSVVTLVVRDHGRWRAPRGEHRGRGLAMIEALMDGVEVTRGERGSEVTMRRRLTRA